MPNQRDERNKRCLVLNLLTAGIYTWLHQGGGGGRFGFQKATRLFRMTNHLRWQSFISYDALILTGTNVGYCSDNKTIESLFTREF